MSVVQCLLRERLKQAEADVKRLSERLLDARDMMMVGECGRLLDDALVKRDRLLFELHNQTFETE